jgi:hypothetical protein
VLVYSINIEGDFEHRSGHRDEYYKWSTRRKLEASLELLADKPQKQSRLFPEGAAAPQTPDQGYQDMAKQMEACPKNDTACQMQLAMKMMGSDYMQQQIKASEDMQQVPERYQSWHPHAGTRVDAKVAYDDHREEVYYTAGREYHDCHLAVQDPLSDLGRKFLDGMARNISIEVDVQTGRQRMLIPYTGDVPGQSTCLEGMGSNKANMEKRQQDEFVHFFPKMDVAAGLEGDASGADPAVISSGEQTVEGVVGNITGFTSQREAPVRITVRWKLTRE